MQQRHFISLLVLVSSVVSAASEIPNRSPDGGAGWDRQSVHDSMSFLERARIWNAIDKNRATLTAQGILSSHLLRGASPSFLWPVVGVGRDPGYQAISNFVDHNEAYPDELQDYTGGTRTYDTNNGYNHAGIDIFSWPFSWLLMEQNRLEIRAAAPGTIIFREDGNFDRNCDFGSGRWNAVYVQHSDGSIAWYGHLKSGSVTPKTVGQSVVEGEYLGVMGSSGNSTGPHLHFEVYDQNDNLIDPFAGPFNALNAFSWWDDQPEYRTPTLNRVATHIAPPDFGTCPQIETPNTRNHFNPGDRVHFIIYLRDHLVGQVTTLTVRRPDGTIYDSWSHTANTEYTTSYWYWWNEGLTIPGTWSLAVDFLEQSVTHRFAIGDLLLYGGFGDDL